MKHITLTSTSAALAAALLAACGSDGSSSGTPATEADTATPLAVSVASSDTLPAGRYVIVNAASGKCVDVAGASTADGGNIQQANCSTNLAQAFDLVPTAAGVYALKNVASGKMVDVASASTADGANIQQFTDNGTAAQRFRVARTLGNRYTLTNLNSGKCVDVASGSLADGANIQQFTCNGSGAQQFHFYPRSASGRGPLPVGRYTLSSAHSRLCLEVQNASGADGARVVQKTCGSAAAQRFDVLPETEGSVRLLNAASGKSLDIEGVSLANGAALQQWSSTSGDNQRFVVNAANGGWQLVARHSRRCLDLKDWSTATGGGVQQWDCADQANQRWALTPADGTDPVTPTPTPTPPAGWRLVWQDEFDGTAVDTTKWNFEVNGGGGGNNELQYYTARPQNASVANGLLSIHARAERYCAEDGCRDYTSARLTTRNKGDWLYGRIEARARLPGGQGLWPAIWMLPTDWNYGGWAASGEIDIMEAVNAGAAGGNTVYGTLHYGGAWPNNVHKGGNTVPDSSIIDNFHVYAVEWEPKEIRFYVDGRLYHTATEWWSSGGAFPAPFDRRFHVLLNVAVGGNWPGAPNAATRFPQRMDVDYVRVYQR